MSDRPAGPAAEGSVGGPAGEGVAGGTAGERAAGGPADEGAAGDTASEGPPSDTTGETKPGDTAGGKPQGDTAEESPDLDPRDIGSVDAPPVAEKPYKLVFEANKCIGAGHCAAASDNWSLDLSTGIARPTSYFRTESQLDDALAAAEACPAKRGIGVIHVVDRRTGEELAPDPDGDGSLSVDW